MSGLVEGFLAVHIQDPRVLAIAYACGASASLFVALRRRPHRLRQVVIASAAGSAVGVAALWLVEGPLNLTGVPLLWPARYWVLACFAALAVAAAALRRSRWWHRAVTLAAAAVLVATTGLGINAVYGVNQTMAAALGLSAGTPIALPPTADLSALLPVVPRNPFGHRRIRPDSPLPLAVTWRPPSDLPAAGRVGTVVIPGTVSGFTARPAGIYLPPAALVAHPPPLPVVVFMFGQPGSPDTFLARESLDALARQHHGLAPIVVVADQLGSPGQDTLCLNTPTYGNVETYIDTDVVSWVRHHLNVSPLRSAWTVAGFSNGAQCAVSFAAKHPETWGNLVSISGEAFPGFEHQSQTLADIFHGNQAAYDAQKPVTLLGRRLRLVGNAFFSYGSNDDYFAPGVVRVIAAARAAGLHVTVDVIPQGGHVEPALSLGNAAAMAWLYPRLGLAAPRG